ncbi:hypothetical protein LZ554_001592 [Drepanopeziza brunnea f. sp. 'monogermtubi']|nr:hypothetical protein LZ554_001592 [Drepanopeziza brunnea f. sp. 'monogermtubi']
MRAFRVSGRIGERASSTTHSLLLLRPVSRSRIAGSTKTRRYHNASSSSSSPSSTWTPYGLNRSKPPKPASSDLSRLTKKINNGEKRVAYIALGSNLGDRVRWIEEACTLMGKEGIRITRTSGLWETEPMYVKDQASFLNGVAEVETTLEPIDLLNALQAIENGLGRKKIIDKGPRNIDLDILLYEDQVIDHSRLKVPHPLMYEREFVLRPLAELIPGKSLNPAHPWKVTQDYLNDLPPSGAPISTVTPMPHGMEPIHALDPRRSTRVMAILNATPDSFSDGGKVPQKQEGTNKFNSSPNQIADLDPPQPEGDVSVFTIGESSKWGDALMTKAVLGFNSGGVICDIGGQSTAPGVAEVSVEEETKRVLLAIEEIRDLETTHSYKEFSFSVDTYRALIAEAAINAGVSIINDVSAGQMDPEMLPTMARLGVTVILMHMRGTPQTMNKLTDYPSGLISTIAAELLERVAEAEAAGVRRWRIILDPGIGFAKTAEQNLEILRRLDELRDWPGLRGLPWLVGSSRKSFIGKVTGQKKPDERTWGTAATVAAAVQGGADIVRVHDVKEMQQVVKMADAIWRA